MSLQRKTLKGAYNLIFLMTNSTDFCEFIFADYFALDATSASASPCITQRTPLREMKRRQGYVCARMKTGAAAPSVKIEPIKPAKRAATPQAAEKSPRPYIPLTEEAMQAMRVIDDFLSSMKSEFATKRNVCRLQDFNLIDLDHLHQFLSVFGSSIHALDVTLPNLFSADGSCALGHEIQEAIVHYCGHTLTDLRLAHFRVKNVQLWLPVFGHLRTLHLYRCRFTPEFVQLLAKCVDLEEFDWNGLLIETDWPLRMKLPKLKKFHVNEVVGLTVETLSEFIRLNPQLTHLSVTNCMNIDTRIFANAAKHLPVIESISFLPHQSSSTFTSHLLEFQYSKTLRTLRIGFSNDKQFEKVVIDSLLPTLQLDELELANCSWTEELANGLSVAGATLKSLGLYAIEKLNDRQLVKALKRMTNLSRLNCVAAVKVIDKNIIDIVRAAHQLQDFHLDARKNDTAISIAACKRLADIVTKRANKIPLNIVHIQQRNGRAIPTTWSSLDKLLTIDYDTMSRLCEKCHIKDCFRFNVLFNQHAKQFRES